MLLTSSGLRNEQAFTISMVAAFGKNDSVGASVTGIATPINSVL
jgi:hypothetical protein